MDEPDFILSKGFKEILDWSEMHYGLTLHILKL